MPTTPQSRDLGQLIWDLLEQDRTIELGAIAMSLVRFYLSQELIFEFLDAVILRDISKTEDVNTLFRGNTLATKSVDNFMKVNITCFFLNVFFKIILLLSTSSSLYFVNFNHVRQENAISVYCDSCDRYPFNFEKNSNNFSLPSQLCFKSLAPFGVMERTFVLGCFFQKPVLT